MAKKKKSESKEESRKEESAESVESFQMTKNMIIYLPLGNGKRFKASFNKGDMITAGKGFSTEDFLLIKKAMNK